MRMLSYRCDRLAAHLLRDESLLIVDDDSSKLIRLHDYHDRLPLQESIVNRTRTTLPNDHVRALSTAVEK
ncbi:hypothetical protein [Rhodococcus opacus]|uniref:hypothetical protein n=1 Tax=Rhodococcus opacus TaxID=37919 RepID=UPI001C20C139|nr:hypothetical protein [Rhodococcus opacus]